MAAAQGKARTAVLPLRRGAEIERSGQAVSLGKFDDNRWVDGTWDLKRFAVEGGETDWDGVIDAEARSATAF